MSKIVIIFTLFLLLVSFLTPQVHAQVVNDCPVPMRTDPTPIFSDRTKTERAKFIANVSPSKTSDYQWKIQFECDLIQDVGNATIENDTEISREMPNFGCIFQTGNHTIKVIAVTRDRGEVPQCIARYAVIDSDSQCELTINPETGITSASNLTVSGKNLTSNQRFGLFMDNQILKGVHGSDFVGTPEFDPWGPIPNNLLTPNSHTISLRKYNGIIVPLLPTRLQDYGSPLCPLVFIVGTPSNPGGVIRRPPGRGTDFGPPAASGGKQCGSNDNPAIATAIGCIHTSPAAFVKDFLTFIIGIAGGLAFLMMLLGAFQMLTSAGNPETLSAGKDRLTSAVIGLLFVIFAVLLLQIIGAGILNIPGFGS